MWVKCEALFISFTFPVLGGDKTFRNIVTSWSIVQYSHVIVVLTWTLEHSDLNCSAWIIYAQLPVYFVYFVYTVYDRSICDFGR